MGAFLGFRSFTFKFTRMKKLLSLLSCLLAWAATSGQSGTILPYKIHQHLLPNGMNVVTVPYASPGVVAFHIVVRVGSREEVEPGKTGFAHFFEHMMFRGTDKYSKEKYDLVLKSTGAAANANTSDDRTIYHMTGNAEKLETMFELEADRFQFLKYSVHDFKTEAGAVKGEYTKNYASPYQQLFEKLQNTAFDVHTYKHTTMGFFADIIDMPNQYDYSLEFFKRFYKPEYCTIVCVGDVTPEQVNTLAEKYFGAWKKGSFVANIPTEPEQTTTRYCHLENGGIPPVVSIHFKNPAFSETNKELAALDVFAKMLFSPKGRLYNKLILEEQKCFWAEAWNSSNRDPNLFSIMASVEKKEDLQYVKDEIMKEISAMSAKVDPSLLKETVSNIRYSFAVGLDNPESIADALDTYIYLSGNPESLNTYYALYGQLTAADIMAAAKKYLVPEHMTVATISADKEGGVK